MIARTHAASAAHAALNPVKSRANLAQSGRASEETPSARASAAGAHPDDAVHVTEGWAIVDSRGRVWGGSLYPTAEAAERTAAACLATSWTVSPARLVEWGSVRPGNRKTSNESQILLGDAV